jgi:hypothetical protein
MVWYNFWRRNSVLSGKNQRQVQILRVRLNDNIQFIKMLLVELNRIESCSDPEEISRLIKEIKGQVKGLKNWVNLLESISDKLE